MSVRTSFCTHWTSRPPTERIFIKFCIWVLYQNLTKKFKCHQRKTRITGTLHDDQYTFLIISRSFLLRMRNFQTKVVEKTKTRILCSITFFPKIVPFMIVWKNIVEADRPPDSIIQCMRIACWITRGADTHSMCNTYCFCTATVVARTRPSVTLYEHGLSL